MTFSQMRYWEMSSNGARGVLEIREVRILGKNILEFLCYCYYEEIYYYDEEISKEYFRQGPNESHDR